MSNEKNQKQAEEIRVSRQLAEKLKSRWEELRSEQNNNRRKVRKGQRISSISLTKNIHGKISVRVETENGKSLTANRQEAVASFKRTATKVYSRFKIESLLKKIRENGWASVEGDIPADLKEVVLKACQQAGISTSSRGEKAEREAQHQMHEVAAKAADTRDTASPVGTMAAGATAAGIAALAAAGLAQTNPPAGYAAYKIEPTPAIQAAMDKGVKFEIPEIPTTFSAKTAELAQFQTQQTLDIAANMIGDRDVIKIEKPRNFSPAIARTEEIQTPEGIEKIVTKGSAFETNIISNNQKLLLAMIGEGTKTPAMQKCYDLIADKIRKRNHLPEDCPEEELRTFMREAVKGGLANQISVKGLEKEFAENQHSYSPEFEAARQEYCKQQPIAIAEKETHENASKMAQISQVLTTEPEKLTQKGLALHDALSEMKISTMEQVNQNSDAIAKILARGKYFERLQGTVSPTCLQSDIDAFKQAREEARKQPSIYQQIIEGKTKPEDFTFNQLRQDAREKRKYLTKDVTIQRDCLEALKQKYNIQDSAPVSSTLFREASELREKFQAMQQQSKLSLDKFMVQEGLRFDNKKKEGAEKKAENVSEIDKRVDRLKASRDAYRAGKENVQPVPQKRSLQQRIKNTVASPVQPAKQTTTANIAQLKKQRDDMAR